jgi:hypothetical protein
VITANGEFANFAVSPKLNKRSREMDNVTMIRVIASALAVVVLGIIIYRRKRKSVE